MVVVGFRADKGSQLGYAVGRAISFGAGCGGGVQTVDVSLVPSTCTIAARYRH